MALLVVSLQGAAMQLVGCCWWLLGSNYAVVGVLCLVARVLLYI